MQLACSTSISMHALEGLGPLPLGGPGWLPHLPSLWAGTIQWEEYGRMGIVRYFISLDLSQVGSS